MGCNPREPSGKVTLHSQVLTSCIRGIAVLLPQTFRQLGLLSLLLCAASGYGVYIDRQTPVALDLVELQAQLGVPIPALFAGLGLFLVVWSLFMKAPQPKYSRPRPPITPRPPPSRPSSPTPTPQTRATVAPPTGDTPPADWWSTVRAASASMDLPEGARVTLEQDKRSPIILHLEMAPPERCKRAIREVASWFSQFSTPPRMRIEFDHCPEGASPRHHMVNGALSAHLDRGSFKVMTDRDAVDVIFHQPDPRWHNPS